MANTRNKKPVETIKDEPGADQRFSNILKRALNTPPSRKDQKQARKRKPPKINKGS